MLFYSTLISKNLAWYEVFCAEVCDFWQMWYNFPYPILAKKVFFYNFLPMLNIISLSWLLCNIHTPRAVLSGLNSHRCIFAGQMFFSTGPKW